MRGLPTYIINAVIVTLLPGSVGLGLHLPGSPEPNSGCRSYVSRNKEKEGEGLIVILSVFKIFPKITEKLIVFSKNEKFTP